MKTIFKSIIIMVIGIIIGIGIIVLNKTTKKVSCDSFCDCSPVRKLKKQIVIKDNNWFSYRNDILGIKLDVPTYLIAVCKEEKAKEVRFPDEMAPRIKEGKVISSFTDFGRVNFFDRESEFFDYPGGGNINILITENYPFSNLDEWLARTKKRYVDFVIEKELEISGQKALVVYFNQEKGGEFEPIERRTRYAIFFKNGKKYEIYTHTSYNFLSLNDLNRIWSSFEVIE